MEMLGWTIDTVSMMISVTQEKVAQLRAFLVEWPMDQRVATVKEVRSLLGKLLYSYEEVRPGKRFVRPILNQLGLAPLKAGEDTSNKFGVGGKQRRGCVRLSREFHDDLAFWRIVVKMATGPNGITRNRTSDKKRWTSLPRSWPQAHRKISCGIVSIKLSVRFPVLGVSFVC